jgi:hypothetical protein
MSSGSVQCTSACGLLDFLKVVCNLPTSDSSDTSEVLDILFIRIHKIKSVFKNFTCENLTKILTDLQLEQMSLKKN